MSARHEEIAAWAESLVGETITDIIRRPGGGRHEAWDVHGGDGGLWFLRADAEAPSDYEHYTLRREAEIYRAVERAGIPTASILGIHPTHEAVLMAYVPGTARLGAADVDTQHDLITQLARQLARLHAADPETLDLPSLGPIRSMSDHVVDELDIWEARLDSSGIPDPFLTACFRWLRDHLPVTPGRPCLVQGDTGPGNFLHQDGRLTALLDFELGHLGDPMEDLAWVGTRNAQEPVPDFEAFVTAYLDAGGAAFDPDRFLYHSLLAELRIAVLGVSRAGARTDPMDDLGSRLIYAVLHRRLTVEALAAAAGVELPDVELGRAGDTDQTVYYDGALAQLREIVAPNVDDAFATQRLKSVARVLKYLREVDRTERPRGQELDALDRLLGTAPESVEAGLVELDRRVRNGDFSAVDLLEMAEIDVARRQQVTAPAMGVLAQRHLPPPPAR